jgi:hypothetical protein
MIRVRYSPEPYHELELEGSNAELAALRDRIQRFASILSQKLNPPVDETHRKRVPKSSPDDTFIKSISKSSTIAKNSGRGFQALPHLGCWGFTVVDDTLRQLNDDCLSLTTCREPT